MGGTPKERTRHRKIPGATHRHPSPGVPLRGRASLSPLFPDQPTPHVLSGLPCARLVYFHGRCRGRVQSSHRHTAQTSRNALDCSRLQRHHRSPLCQAEWSLSGLLGTQNGTEGRMTHHFLGVHPCGYEECKFVHLILLSGIRARTARPAGIMRDRLKALSHAWLVVAFRLRSAISKGTTASSLGAKAPSGAQSGKTHASRQHLFAFRAEPVLLQPGTQLTVGYDPTTLNLFPLSQNRRELAQGVDFSFQENTPRTHLERVDSSTQLIDDAHGQPTQHQGCRHVLEVHKLTISLRKKRLARRKFRHCASIMVIYDCFRNHPALISPELGAKTQVHVFGGHEEIIVQKADILEHG